MHIAVTGATGFLGRYLVRRLCNGGHRLRCSYRPESDRSGLEGLSVDWLPGQLGEGDAVVRLIEGVDAVVHAALYRPRRGGFVGSARDDLSTFLERNLMGSLQLFQAAFAARVGRFVFISTCGVHDVILPDRPLDEAHPLWPQSHYGAHKAALEKFVHSYGLGQGWPICALRPTGIYGLAHPPASSKWFDLVGRVLRGEPVSSPAGGKEVHAEDVAHATELLLGADAEAIRGQAFNCYDRYVSDEEVARIARELTGSPSAISDLNRGPKNQIQTGKLRALGFEPGGAERLRQTVAELIAAHRAY
jgi:nucleoside-diphosphate-sugar epimerase